MDETMVNQKRRHRKRRQNCHANDWILTRNIPTNVDILPTLTQAIADYVSQALMSENTMDFTLRVVIRRKEEAWLEVAGIVRSRDDCLLASIHLAPSGGEESKHYLHCRGVGYIMLQKEDVADSLDHQAVVTTLNEFASSFEIKSHGGTKDMKSTLLFSWGSYGQEAERAVRAKGREKQNQLIQTRAANLLQLMEQNGGTLHLWPMKDRAIVNDLGRHRRLRPLDAAKAAGVLWNGQTQMFSLTKKEYMADSTNNEKGLC